MPANFQNNSFNKNSGYQRRDDAFRPKYDGPNKNQYIRAKEVLLIDEKGENVGVVPIQEALDRAQEAGLDLVEVGAAANPPVCRIIDFAKYLYEQKKKKKLGAKSGKSKPMKEFRFSPVIGQGDMNMRIKRAKEYLSKGHNVRITMFRKGRITPEQAKAKFEEILTYFEGFDTIEVSPINEGRRLFLTFKSDGKTKNKQNSSEEIQAQ